LLMESIHIRKAVLRKLNSVFYDINSLDVLENRKPMLIKNQ